MQALDDGGVPERVGGGLVFEAGGKPVRGSANACINAEARRRAGGAAAVAGWQAFLVLSRDGGFPPFCLFFCHLDFISYAPAGRQV